MPLTRDIFRGSNLRVLFLYPNMFMMNMVPPAISIFSSLLKSRRFEVGLFDTTYHNTDNAFDSDKKKESTLQVRPFNLGERGIKPKTSNVYDDWEKKIQDFKPDLIAASVVEDIWPLCHKLLTHTKRYRIPTLVGGVFATFAPHLLIREDVVDMVCVGEGEGAIVDLCERMAKGADYADVANLWVKRNGKVIKNPIRPRIQMDELPIPDFKIFEDQRLYRPMAGKVYRMLPMETHRGCPYSCHFCNSPAQQVLYRSAGSGSYFRKKSIAKVREELEWYAKEYQIEYVYFTADTFLAWSDREFDEFIEMYSDFRLPFWMQTRCETIEEPKMKKLKDVGIHRMSLGLEHGNEKFRREVIKRNISNARIIEAFAICSDLSIPVTVNNIVGFPDETRELAQDTIEINTRITVDTTNCYAFTPFHGTPLRRYSVQKGYIEEETFTGCLTGEPVLNMPQFPKKAIMGLMRTLPMYSKFPREMWPKIAIAEQMDSDGERVYKELRDEYTRRFFTGESVS